MDAPAEVDAVAAGESGNLGDVDDPLAAVYDDFSGCRTTVEERELYEGTRWQLRGQPIDIRDYS